MKDKPGFATCPECLGKKCVSRDVFEAGRLVKQSEPCEKCGATGEVAKQRTIDALVEFLDRLMDAVRGTDSVAALQNDGDKGNANATTECEAKCTIIERKVIVEALERKTTEYHKIETLFERDLATHKVDPAKLKNPVYGIFKTWQFTEKIDGTNVRCIWTPHSELTETEPMRRASLTFGGKTDNAQIHADLVTWLYANVTAEKMAAIFPDTAAVVYGEGYGAGIQRGGHYSAEKRFAAFDVLVGGKWWLNWDNTCDVAQKLGLDTVPFIGEMTLEEGVEMVRGGFNSEMALRNNKQGTYVPAEGLVGRTVETLFDKKGHRIIIKLKTKDFA